MFRTQHVIDVRDLFAEWNEELKIKITFTYLLFI